VKNKRYATRIIAWAVTILSWAAVAISFYLFWMGSPDFIIDAGVLSYPMLSIVTPVLGLVILHFQPDNRYAWVWLSLGLANGILLFTQNYLAVSLNRGIPAPVLFSVAHTLTGIAWVTLVALVSYIFLLFPSGRAPSRRWRWLGLLVAAAYILTITTAWAANMPSGWAPMDNPTALAGAAGQIAVIVSNIGLGILFLGAPIAVASLFFRYRSADAIERLQLRWFIFGAVIWQIVITSDFFYTLPGIWDPVKESGAFYFLILCIGIAVIRYQLFDIDLIIRRTTSYAILTSLLALIYFGSVILLQRLLAPLTGDSTIAVVFSTLLIAVLFLPVRRRVQDAIDRRFFRKKYDAAKTLETFANTVRNETDLDALTAELLRVIRETMQPEYVSIWLKPAESENRPPAGAFAVPEKNGPAGTPLV
jgi:hypothetical protein